MPALGHNTTDLIIIEDINKKLYERGRSLDGRPILRVVWTSDEWEIRFGEHNEWSSSGNIWLSSWVGAKWVRKYNYMMDRWVLERLTFLPLDNEIVKKELPHARNGTYEPLHVFIDKNGNPLPVMWEAIEYALKVLYEGPGYKSSTEREEMLEKSYELETGQFEEILADAGRSNLFAFENSVFLDSTKQSGLFKSRR